MPWKVRAPTKRVPSRKARQDRHVAFIVIYAMEKSQGTDEADALQEAPSGRHVYSESRTGTKKKPQRGGTEVRSRPDVIIGAAPLEHGNSFGFMVYKHVASTRLMTGSSPFRRER